MKGEVSEEFLSPYNHQKKEKEIYNLWEKSGYFNPDNLKNTKDNYSIIMPPPNANGELHAGHALFITTQDTLIRYNRMLGKKTLWLPGADHAGFETQVVYEKILEKEGRSRFKMSDDDFYKEVWDFTQKNKINMRAQLKALGASCDWSREVFTLDKKIQDGVYNTFNKLYKDKLLYKDFRSINWCPKHQTGLSDLEIEQVEKKDPFYYFKFGPFEIGTVRPETKFADKYIVINPNDKRYKDYKHMQKIKVDWINGEIEATIIKDEAGEIDKGSGVMTITPWHSGIDYEIAKKYNLDFQQIIDERGKLLKIAGEFEGQSIMDSREKIVNKLKEMGLLVRVDNDYKHSVPVCYKCKREVEPQLKDQWFINMKPLAKKAINKIENREVKFLNKKFEKESMHWLRNIKDWNISRQIAWGIKMPTKNCLKCSKGFVDIDNSLEKCSKCDSKLIEEKDVFDTWFSSAQWPFLTLRVNKENDFSDFYPTSVMETGRDILFFWVLRMLMIGLYETGKVPFKTIYLHELVMDEKGKKMSKSLGNVINPINVSEEYGADSLRMSYLVGNPPGDSINFSLDKVRTYRKFSNKLWNIARFTITETLDYENDGVLTKEDRLIANEADEKIKEIMKHMDNYRIHIASEELYHYVWHKFADIILEESKDIIKGQDIEKKKSRQELLRYILYSFLKMLHPFMPHITEAIWQELPEYKLKKENILMIERLPEIKGKGVFRSLLNSLFKK